MQLTHVTQYKLIAPQQRRFSRMQKPKIVMGPGCPFGKTEKVEDAFDHPFALQKSHRNLFAHMQTINSLGSVQESADALALIDFTGCRRTKNLAQMISMKAFPFVSKIKS